MALGPRKEVTMADQMAGCSLRDREASERIAAWAGLIGGSLTGGEPTTGGFALHFAAREGLERELRRLAGLEAECCGTLTFDVRAENGAVSMYVDGPWKETPWLMAMGAVR
ncbi:MAG: hypothetical protein ACRDJP_16310 [Actinomycetota bacterium]